jgi:PadR family transcriptional regulator PadR
MTTTPLWPGDWLRGVLDVCVLRVLADGPTYGYAIATRLADAGLGALKGGTLYPLLARFESAGLVAVEWRAGEGGPGRKYYALTDDGHRAWREQAVRWAEFARLTSQLVTSQAAATDATPDAAVSAAAMPTPDTAVSPPTMPTPATGPLPVRNGARP